MTTTERYKHPLQAATFTIQLTEQLIDLLTRARARADRKRLRFHAAYILTPLDETTRTLTFELKQGLAETVIHAKKYDDAAMVYAARALGARSRNADLCRAVLVAYSQIKWYESKGAAGDPAFERVTTTFNTALQDATTVDETVEKPEGAAPKPPKAPKEPKAKKETRGTRPFVRKLILEGNMDEKDLLARVHAEFPDKVAVFKIGDVRGQMRVAGKKAWTTRKGQGKLKLDTPKPEQSAA